MKKIIEEVVPENVNILEKITELAEKDKVWIFISYKLMKRLLLEDNYDSSHEYHDYFTKTRKDNYSKGYVLHLGEKKLFLDDIEENWNKVSEENYLFDIPLDPNVIYFLN